MDKPQNVQLKIAYEKEIILSETSSVDQLTKKDKERMEFMLIMVYISHPTEIWWGIHQILVAFFCPKNMKAFLHSICAS